MATCNVLNTAIQTNELSKLQEYIHNKVAENQLCKKSVQFQKVKQVDCKEGLT